jgi:hypothetical protein
MSDTPLQAVADSRTSEVRKSDKLYPSQMTLPFSFCQPQFGYTNKKINLRLPGQSYLDVGEFPSGFPSNIQEYLWISQGNPGTDSWLCLGRLTSGIFFYYTATTYDTPRTFIDGGLMTLCVTTDYSKIINYAMNQEEYTQYINETIPYTIYPIVEPNPLPSISSSQPPPPESFFTHDPVPMIFDPLKQE